MLTALKAFPYKATCFVGVAYLLNWFIAGVHPNSWEIIGMPLFLYLVVSGLRNLIIVISNLRSPPAEKSRISLRRFLLSLAFLILTIPTARFGQHLKTELFLNKLPRYQQLVDVLVEKEKSHFPELTTVPLPEGYSDLGLGQVTIGCTDDQVITVEFLTDDYGIPAEHEGYIYISTDDPSSLKNTIQYRDVSFFRVAPNWYAWAD